MEDLQGVNIHVHPSGEKTAYLNCNWCGESHLMEQEYREKTLIRGAKAASELKLDVPPEETWTCGRCMLVVTGLRMDFIPTDCHVHDVPKERVVKR